MTQSSKDPILAENNWLKFGGRLLRDEELPWRRKSWRDMFSRRQQQMGAPSFLKFTCTQ